MDFARQSGLCGQDGYYFSRASKSLSGSRGKSVPTLSQLFGVRELPPDHGRGYATLLIAAL
jgi:hypothetical protein